MQKVITLDSQILNNIQLCERKTQYVFIDSITPVAKGESLERGDLMHKMLEVYEGLRCGLAPNETETETWQYLNQEFPYNPEMPIDEYTIGAARRFATKLDLGQAEIEEVIKQFEDYSEFYKDDPWETLAVEATGTKVLHEDSNIQFLYSFKIDRLARKDNLLVPWDYKTSKRRKETSSLSNQFIGYAWATESNYVVIDKIGFQKTLAPSERFQRIFLSYDNDRIEEWRRNSIYWAYQYARLLEEGTSTMNLTSCDKFSGCIYRPICEKSPNAREWTINRDYRVQEKWDPARTLESVSE